MTTTLSPSGNAVALVPNKGGHVFVMSDGSLVAVWMEGGGAVPMTLRRSRSADGGATWQRADPTAITLNGSYWLGMCKGPGPNGADTIFGFNFFGVTSQMFSMWWSGATTNTWTDAAANYTFTASYTGAPVGRQMHGEVRYDSSQQTIHVLLTEILLASPSGFNAVLIAFSTAIAKITEANYQIGSGTKRGALRVQSGSPSTLTCVTQGGAANDEVHLRQYTFNGSTYTNTVTDETVVAAGSGATDGIAVSLDASSQPDVIYVQGGVLKTKKRTATNTYSGATTIVASGLPSATSVGFGDNNDVAISESGNTNADIWVLFKSVVGQLQGEVWSVRRTNSTWRTQVLLNGGSAAGRNAPSPIQAVGADNIVHVLYCMGNDTSLADTDEVYTVAYDNVPMGVPTIPTNVKPNNRGVTSLTPTISATYNNPKAGDALGKYRVVVQRVSDNFTMWDTGAGGTSWGGATILPGGTFSITYAGTALVIGTDYIVGVMFWDADENYASPWSDTLVLGIIATPGYSTFLFPWAGTKSNTNWATRTQTSAELGGGKLVTDTTAQNNLFTADEWLDAGTYKLALVYFTNTDRGIFSVTGISGTQTVDSYAATTDNVYSEVTGITVTAGLKTVQFQMATKNASSSAYGGSLQTAALIRTGA